MIKIIYADGRPIREITDRKGEPSLEELSKWIGCRSTEVSYADEFCQFVVDEEGKLAAEPRRNIVATMAWHALFRGRHGEIPADVLVGTVVILDGENMLT